MAIKLKGSGSSSTFGRPRVGALPFNDWPIVEILSHGLSDREVTRRNGNDTPEQVTYNRSYFSTDRDDTAASLVYRLSSDGFTFEVWQGLKAVKANIPSGKGVGKAPGVNVIAACLIEDGATSIVDHVESQGLVDLYTEFYRRQSSMDSHDLENISIALSAHGFIPRQNLKSTDHHSYKLRIPAKVWDDSGINDLSTGIGYPSYWLASLCVMASLVKQPDVNPAHSEVMYKTIHRHKSAIESKYRMVKACLEVARDISWGPRAVD